MPVMSPLMTVMHKAAEKAVKDLLRDFGELENLQVSEKSPNNFVTAADKRAEATIYHSLKKDRPDWGFLMEESGEVKSESEKSDHSKRFIIDPIDGTHNFMRGIPHWCISIAAEEDGVLTAALILDPLRNEFFMAEKGKGAFCNHRRMRVSGRKELEKSTIAFWYVTSHEYNREEPHILTRIEDDLRSKAAATRQGGSTCLDMAWIAAGRMDGYIQGSDHMGAWDGASGCLLVAEAGGVFTDWNGKKNDAIYQKYFIAGNADIHPQLLAIAQKGAK